MKTIDEMIEVMSAFKAGKAIQYRIGCGDWLDIDCSPSWRWDEVDYRIKPREPRRIWVNCRAGGIGQAWVDKETAEQFATGAETVEFVEVLKP